MDCKKFNIRYIVAKVFLLVTFLGLTSATFAQKTVSGKVVDESNEPLIGVTVAIQGTTIGTISDIDGKYNITVPSGTDEGIMVFSFIGYESVTMPIPASGKLDIQMTPAVTELNEVVAIGYGTKRKGDLTGSIASVSEKDFNGGVVSSPEQLINGKVAGVQIVNGGGSPSGGSTIRVRGGASLNASNDPLIVLDGVPLETGGISGSSNFLSLINPADIESMSVLKDASSTAIYGSRASNGVIIITTKKGAKDDLKINFNTTNSVSFKTKTADMLSADELREVVNAPATIAEKGDLTKYLGDANTDWIDEVFRPAWGTDNNLSVSGNIAKVLPVRVSLGYMAQDGILLNDNTKRYSGNINFNPTFFHDALKVNLSVKASMNQNKFAPQGAIYTAQNFNPTQPVYSGNDDVFLGYNEVYNVGEDGGLLPIASASTNPVGLLNYRKDESTVNRLITNLDVDYTFPFLKDLRAHITGGLDYGKGEGNIYVPAEAYDEYQTGGSDYEYGPQKSSNKLFTGYLNYSKSLDIVNFDLTAGYDYQYWNTNCDEYKTYNAKGVENGTSAAYDQTHVLLSYYGRLNTTFLGKYMLTATIRRDGTSRFSKDERWGTFPSVALAWRLSEESFMEGLRDVMNNLKFRVSYGVTGQQDGIGNYGYLPIYSQSTSFYSYLWNGTPIATYLPSAYVENLKWETTKSWNFGIDFGFLKDRVSGSIEYYTRKTEDLIATVPAAAGSNFDNQITTNVGNVESKGVEFSVNYNVLNTKDWGLDMSFNATWEKYEITNLSLTESDDVVNTPMRYAEKDAIQYFTEGQTPYAFYLYHQLYDANGNPIEGAYSNDKYFCHYPAPDWMFSYSLSLRYKKWTLGTSLRANVGNYVYNATAAKMGAVETIAWGDGQINTLSSTYLDSKFKQRQYQSDYYLHNASFLKMDNVSLGYNFGQLTQWMSLNATFMVQNVFTATKYEGVDPEISTGIEDSFYPRPRTFSLALSFQF